MFAAATLPAFPVGLASPGRTDASLVPLKNREFSLADHPAAKRYYECMRRMISHTERDPNYDESPEGEALSLEMEMLRKQLPEVSWEAELNGDQCNELSARYREVIPCIIAEDRGEMIGQPVARDTVDDATIEKWLSEAGLA